MCPEALSTQFPLPPDWALLPVPVPPGMDWASLRSPAVLLSEGCPEPRYPPKARLGADEENKGALLYPIAKGIHTSGQNNRGSKQHRLTIVTDSTAQHPGHAHTTQLLAPPSVQPRKHKPPQSTILQFPTVTRDLAQRGATQLCHYHHHS